MTTTIRTLTIVTLFVLLCATAASADTYPSDSFEEWLEKYGAWDQLEKEYAADTDKDSPDTIIKRAAVYLNLNSPEQALELLEMTQSFADNATESERLWLGGQAHRALGDLPKAVLWFSQAATFIQDESEKKKRFKAESGLETIWKDVWLKLYWSYAANPSVSKEIQRDILWKIQVIGQQVWGGDYWEKAYFALNPTEIPIAANAPVQELGPDGLPVPPLITRADTEIITRALAAISLEKFNEAIELTSSISNNSVRFFWISVIKFLESGALPADLTPLSSDNYLKALVFWQGNVLAPYSTSNTNWLLGNPDSGPWTKFRNKLLSTPVEEAIKAIDNELGSMLISEQTAELLIQLKLALTIWNGNFINASTSWNSIDKSKLPLALQLAGSLLFKEDFKKSLPQNMADAFKIAPILTALSAAAGMESEGVYEAPFWITTPDDKLRSLSQDEYPMDRLLLLAHWQDLFAQKPSDMMAKRSAFLFDDTAYGIQSMLYLADTAVRAKKLQLGAFYLNRINPKYMSTVHRLEWLDIKTRLELDSGRNEAAVQTFGQMNEMDEEIPVMTRLRMALLYQQRRDFKKAKEQLLIMWDNRANLTTTLQAETLFWLGEGEQAMHNQEAALDYYLRLAWQYPQENIWALTAMYRASLIYEKRGKYDTAKRLLTTVVKHADRKEQREAAKARISAIDKKMGKDEGKMKQSTLVYPF